MPYAKLHLVEQRPVTKLPPFPTDRESLRVPLRADRHVVAQSFRDKVYVNVREFYQDLIGREGDTKGARVGHYMEREQRRHGANYSNQSILTLSLPRVHKQAAFWRRIHSRTRDDFQTET